MKLKTWFSAAELAACKLSGLPSCKRAVLRIAARDGWGERAGLARSRSGRGGGLEFHFDLLPASARADLIGRSAPELLLPACGETMDADALGIGAIEGRDARLALVALADRLAREGKLSRRLADRHFCDRYNAGQIAAEAWIARAVKRLSPRTLKRWRADIGAARQARLAVDRGAARRGSGLLDRANGGEVKTFLLALLAKQPQLTAQHLRALACDRYPDGVLLPAASAEAPPARRRMPPVRTFQRALKQWRQAYRNELASIHDPDGFKSRIRFAARVAAPASRLNELWQIDASPADVLLTDGRYSIYVCEDIYSRRLVALISKTPCAVAVGLLIRKAMLAWGVPERIRSDNGPDFIAHTTRRLLAALAIEFDPAQAYQPQQKGHVERAIGTLQRGLMRTLPGFIGHSVADRKVIEQRRSFAQRRGETPEDAFEVALDAAGLQRHVDDWCVTVYGHAPHAGLQGRSPFAAAAEYAGPPVRRIADERALDLLLAPVAGKDGLRTVTKSGLRIEGAYYLAGFLDVGAAVHVRLDPADLGRVYVFSAEMTRFLGTAIAPELAGVDPAAAIAAARAAQKRIINERSAEMRAEARRIKAKDMAPAILRQAAIAAGKLVEFPKATLAHETPALAVMAAANAADSGAHHAPEIAALAERLAAEDARAKAAPVILLHAEETPHQRWQRARAIERALDEQRAVAPDDLIWLGGYREGPEYRGFLRTYEPQRCVIDNRNREIHP